jgi:ankyrin repeat protein
MSEDQSYQSLKEAIEAEDLEKVKDLVENGNFDLNDPNLEENEKPLIRAVISQSANLVEYLIEKGAKVDEAEEALYAACKMACSYDRLHGEDSGTDDLRIIRYLLENGADPNFEKLNETPLDVVCSSSGGGYEKRLEIIKILVETGAYDERIEDPDLSPVLLTCSLGEWAIEIFQYFTEKFPRLLKNEELKNRYLLHASEERQFGIMETLLGAGADINVVDNHGNTPLLKFASAYRVPIGHPFSKESASIDCLFSLIEKGANIKHETARGMNLLHSVLSEMPSEAERRVELGYDISGQGREFFNNMLQEGVPWNVKHRAGIGGKGKTVKEMLVENTLIDWLDCLKEFEGGGGADGGYQVKLEEPSECSIYYGGTEMQEQSISVSFKDGEEGDGIKIGDEETSFIFTWVLPRSLDALLDALAKGTDWIYYSEDWYRKKWKDETPEIDFDYNEWTGGGSGFSPGITIYDSDRKEIDKERIEESGDDGDLEGISFEPSHRGNLTIRDGEGNWIRFDPLPNDYWKISQGTSEDSEKQPLHVDLVSGDEFDLIERVKEICGTPADERKIFLHRNGQTYGPYSRSSVEHFLLENLASQNDWARFKESGEWTRLKDLLEE